MILVGLTGSIGMGKSTTAGMFAEEGAPVYDADAAVHALYAPGGAAVAPIEAAFPGVTGPQGVDRAKLSHRVVGKPDELKRLESIVHPLVAQSRGAFFEEASSTPANWSAPSLRRLVAMASPRLPRAAKRSTKGTWPAPSSSTPKPPASTPAPATG